MVTNNVQGKWDHVKEVEEEEEENAEEEEEEALSLCDLPITLINITDQDQLRKEDSSHDNETQEEFDFRFSKEQEMCAADDVFFQGQILPLRPSFISKAGLLTKNGDHKGNHQLNDSELIRYKSLDLSLSESQSNSSRSSSVRSQNSSSSTSSITTTTTTPRISISKSRIQNQFHTHPSPKPQLKKSPLNQTSSRKSSSTWEFFRIGVVPTPEIGLQDLKVRVTTTTTTKPFLTSANKNCEVRNSNSSSNSTRKSVKMSNKTHHHGEKNNNHVFKQFVHKGGGLFMSGCKCSVETVSSDIVMIKGGTKSSNKTESTQHATKEKVVELKKQKHRQKMQQGKKVMSRHRTFEWLKELHACHPDEEALLSKS